MSENNGNAPAVQPPSWPDASEDGQLDLVGTREAAELLGVERTRIGKWKKRGIMPPLAAEVKATPLWWRHDVLVLAPWVASNRRDGTPPPKPKAKSRRKKSPKQRTKAAA